MFIDSTTDFTVDAASVSPVGEGKLRAIITSPSGTKNDTMVTNNGDGTYNVAYAPYEEGKSLIIHVCTYLPAESVEDMTHEQHTRTCDENIYCFKLC